MSGYINGSEMLLMIGEKPIGSCTSHKVEYKTETKDYAVKPHTNNPVVASNESHRLWKDRSVTGLSISISADGLILHGEKCASFMELQNAWFSGKPISVACFRAGADDNYLEGDFIITSLEETQPACDDATYSISLENAGAPSIFDTSFYDPQLPPAPSTQAADKK